MEQDPELGSSYPGSVKFEFAELEGPRQGTERDTASEMLLMLGQHENSIAGHNPWLGIIPVGTARIGRAL
jgi:hypothetical protein